MTNRRNDIEMPPEFDFESMGPPIRGKYFDRAMKGAPRVRIAPDVAAVFRTETAVNDALRHLIAVARRSAGASIAKRPKRGRRAA